MLSKREFLTAGLALYALPAWAQDESGGKALPSRMAKTTRLFKAPGLWPNALASSPQGLWIAQQHLTKSEADSVHLPWPSAPGKEEAWLVDANGKVLQTRDSDASNTSGVAVGNGFLWLMSNTSDAASGIHQVDIASGKQIAHRQLPLSPGNVTGGIHGGQWQDGKIWVANNRMRSIMRLDPESWTGELQLPITSPPGMARFHDFTFDKDGTLLLVIANAGSTGPADSKAGLMRLDPQTGRTLETIIFTPGSSDPHGLAYHNGMLICCDAGFHPGWSNYASPDSGWVFRIDLI